MRQQGLSAVTSHSSVQVCSWSSLLRFIIATGPRSIEVCTLRDILTVIPVFTCGMHGHQMLTLLMQFPLMPVDRGIQPLLQIMCAVKLSQMLLLWSFQQHR